MIYIHIYMHTHIYTHIMNICVYIHIYIQISVYVYIWQSDVDIVPPSIRMTETGEITVVGTKEYS